MSLDSRPDADPLALLAERALGGERIALELLCRELQGPLFRLALRIVGKPEPARDATQEVLLQVVTHLSQFRGESRFLTWAYTIATRHFLRSRSRLAREREVEVLEGQIRLGLRVTEPTSAPEGDARLLERETRLGCTSAMLGCLTLEERVAVVLVEVLGADDELGARLCETSAVTFRKRLSRARQKLRPILEDLCGLARSEAPCSCPRQARAKQLGQVDSSTYVHLPLVDEPTVARAMEGLGALRRLGPVFAVEPMVGPPEDLWEELRRRLPTVLGGSRP
jgi:RNA polymerase sigma factor (sigma-70 family)